MTNGVVHAVINETMTNIEGPELQEIWLEARYKELDRLVQGWGNTKGTNMIQFMTHKEIAKNLVNRVVTYLRIVCDF